MSKYLFDLLFNENNPHGFHASVSRWSTSLILLNLVAMVLETGEGFAASYAAELDLFETFSVIVFTVEYVLRWIVAPADPEFSSSRFARFRYVTSRYAIIDLLAILPFYIASLVSIDLRLLRALRLFRIFKVTATLLPAYKAFKEATAGMTRRQKVHALLFPPDDSRAGLPLMLDLFLIFWIVVSTLSIVLESVDSIRAAFELHFLILDSIAFFIFFFEYALRVYSVAENNPQRTAASRWKFCSSFNGLIDLISILPFLLEAVLSQFIDLRFLRIVRLTRLLKLSRYSKSTGTMFMVIRREMPVLMASSFIMMLLVFITAAVGYLLESRAQPDKFENIPTAMYWAVITLASVGYGDITPVTAGGRFLTVVLALLGIGVFAIPAAIMSSAFTDQLRAEREEALKLVNNDAANPQNHDLQLMASNPDFALARYRNLLSQMRELAAVSDQAHISHRLETEGLDTEKEVWKYLRSSKP